VRTFVRRFYAVNRESAEVRAALRNRDAMAWMRAEFHLSEAQFTAIRKLHEDYREQCAGHCSAIMAAERRGAAAAEIAALEKTCTDAMGGHFRRVADLMPPGQGTRYLAIVLPRVADYDHRGSPQRAGETLSPGSPNSERQESGGDRRGSARGSRAHGARAGRRRRGARRPDEALGAAC
jgi:hypothetical protein